MKNDEKRKKNEEIWTHTRKSSTIFRVYRCCNFFRQNFFLQYETVAASCFPWFRVKPSTEASPVVIMCNTKGKKVPIVATSVSRKRVFTLSARLAMGSLSEDSSVSEGNTALPRAHRSLASAIGANPADALMRPGQAGSYIVFPLVQHYSVMFGFNLVTMVSKCLVFSTGPASQRVVRHQSHL